MCTCRTPRSRWRNTAITSRCQRSSPKACSRNSPQSITGRLNKKTPWSLDEMKTYRHSFLSPNPEDWRLISDSLKCKAGSSSQLTSPLRLLYKTLWCILHKVKAHFLASEIASIIVLHDWHLEFNRPNNQGNWDKLIIFYWLGIDLKMRRRLYDFEFAQL